MIKSQDSQPSPLTIWTMTSGAAGMRSQVNGLANAIARGTEAEICEKTIELQRWAAPLPGHLNPAPLKTLSGKSQKPAPPWPDLLITSGRRASGVSIAIGQKSSGRTFRVHIQNPQTPSSCFDLVCAMRHDRQKGHNLIETRTALHNLTNDEIWTKAAPFKDIWKERLERQSRGPLVGILLGGKNKKAGFEKNRLTTLIDLIKKTLEVCNAEILITPSRRTEGFVLEALHATFKDEPHFWLWDQKGENPYHAILHYADHLVVTADSVSMISEALYTSKPVHIFPIGKARRRLQRFIDELLTGKLVHLAQDQLDFSVKSTRNPIDETEKLAQIIRQKLAAHQLALRKKEAPEAAKNNSSLK